MKIYSKLKKSYYTLKYAQNTTSSMYIKYLLVFAKCVWHFTRNEVCDAEKTRYKIVFTFHIH